MRWSEVVANGTETKYAYKTLVGKPEGKKELGRLRCRWEDDIKIDLKEKACAALQWIHLAQDRFKRTAELLLASQDCAPWNLLLRK